MSHVYAFRHGTVNYFKVGQTSSALTLRRRQLQVGCRDELTLFGSVPAATAADAADAEQFIHRLLARHRTGIGETFTCTEDDISEALQKTAAFLVDTLPKVREDQAKIAELAAMKSTPEILPATEQLRQAKRRLIDIAQEKTALEDQLKDLSSEQQVLENMIKLTIGSARGVAGVAWWVSGDGRRKFDPDRLKAEQPDLYAQFEKTVVSLDTASLRKQRPKEYEKYMIPRHVRTFTVISDDQTAA